jgi:hypothetical protein
VEVKTLCSSMLCVRVVGAFVDWRKGRKVLRSGGKRVGKEGGERVGGTRKVLRICYR